MAHHVQQLHSAQAVDNAIVGELESDRLVLVRFGRNGHPADCTRVDVVLAAAAERIGPITAIYAVDIAAVDDFNVMYELDDRPCTVMFFYGCRHVTVEGPLRDGAGGTTRDIDWAAYDEDEFAGVVQAVHERARAGCRYVVLG